MDGKEKVHKGKENVKLQKLVNYSSFLFLMVLVDLGCKVGVYFGIAKFFYQHFVGGDNNIKSI